MYFMSTTTTIDSRAVTDAPLPVAPDDVAVHKPADMPVEDALRQAAADYFGRHPEKAEVTAWVQSLGEAGYADSYTVRRAAPAGPMLERAVEAAKEFFRENPDEDSFTAVVADAVMRAPAPHDRPDRGYVMPPNAMAHVVGEHP